MLSSHDALIYAMVLSSAADRDMTDAELRTIDEMVNYLPAFEDFDRSRLATIAGECADILTDEDGLDRAFELIKESLPPRLRETAYALACDVVAADLKASQEELRLLEMMRAELEIDRLVAAAIERGSRARHAVP